MKNSTTLIVIAGIMYANAAWAAAPLSGGDTTVVNPTGETPVGINEDAVQPEQANIRLIVQTLSDPDGGTPSSIRILSVSGGTLWQSNGSSITLGSAGTTLSLTTGKLDLRFRPDAGHDTNASFQYAVVDVQDGSINSAASTATITINPVNDSPVLQTLSGNSGIGLAATYYTQAWDLTGTTFQRIDATINFSNNFGVTGLNVENFSVRWSGQVEAPITGPVTFYTSTDDGLRLWVNDELIIDNWTLHGETLDTSPPVDLIAGEKYTIRMEFYERGGGEVAKLQWSYSGQARIIIPQTYLFPATTRPALSYVNGAASAVIDDAVTVSDVDSTIIASGSVVISSNYVSAEDSLLFTNQNNIVGSYSSGRLLLTGTASLATYQAALRTVRYANNDATPTTSTRTVTFTVEDAEGGASNSTYRNITFTATNNSPVITEGASTTVTMDQDSNPTPFSLTLNATDADYHSITWSISSAASHGTASVSGAGDSKEISYEPVEGYSGSDSFIVQISDGNGGTDTITINVTITERVPPVISDIDAVASGSSGALITWTTDENASTKVQYGLATSNMSTTSETDTSSRVTSHSRSLSNLLSCTTYRYVVISRDTALNTATGSVNTFTTGGCLGNATVSSSTGTNVIHNANGSTGSIMLPNNAASLTVPVGYNASNTICPTGALFQLKKLAATPVKEMLGSPVGRETIVSALNLLAFCPDATPVTSFDESLTITLHYDDADVATLVESSLGAYRYGSGSTAWEELTCSQDASANTLTCDTTHFSSFGLFGTPTSTETVVRQQGAGACRGSNCRTSLRDRSLRPAAPATCSADTLPVQKGKLFLQNVRFSDVAVTEWYACAVHEMIEKGVFGGYRDTQGNQLGKYGPGDSITMGQLAKVVTHLTDTPVKGIVNGKEWALPYVRAAEKLDIWAFDQKLDASRPATRGAVIRTVLEALNIPMEKAKESYYSDVPVNSIYADAIATATILGIVDGDEGQITFRPNAPINRAEVAKIISIALSLAK